jgi:hypothetical protein
MTPDLDSLVELPDDIFGTPHFLPGDIRKLTAKIRIAAFNAGRRYQAGEDAKVCDADPVAIGIFHAAAIRRAAERIGKEGESNE